jgi:hypothetical protein
LWLLPSEAGLVQTLRTVVCIDGFNLYYARLTGTPYKWLDLWTLMDRILASAYPDARAQIQAVKFFTAPVLARYASDPASEHRQKSYHNALKFAPSGSVEVIQGHHIQEQKRGRLLDETEHPELVRVAVLEEKKTDVNLGLNLYAAALAPDVDQVVLVSNDTDFVPALEHIKRDCPNVVRGVIFPVPDAATGKRMATSLDELASWTRRHISEDELAKSQLPRSVLNRKKKAIVRPEKWEPPPKPSDGDADS